MNERTPAHYYLHIRNRGFQWPADWDGIIELRHIVTKETVWEGPTSVVVHALTHFVTGARLTALFLEPEAIPRKALASAPPRTHPPAVGPPLRAIQEARRTARASRVGRSKRTKGAS